MENKLTKGRKKKTRSKRLSNDAPDIDLEDGFEPATVATRRRARRSLKAVSAQKIKEEMDKAVIGQDYAKERLSVLIAMHLAWDYRSNPTQTPPNALIVGPTGSGKTHSIATASAALKLPFVVVDATTLTPSGNDKGRPIHLLGKEIEEEAAPYDKCVVFIDEFDKINEIPGDRNAYWQRHIQKALLKLIEGHIPLAVKPIFFVGGAFTNIEKMEPKRAPEVSRMLRDAPRGTLIADDFINYGFMPELIARIPAVVQFDRLSEAELLEILDMDLTSPFYIWEKYYETIGKSIDFDEETRREIVKRAYSLNLGARALQQIVFPAMSRAAFQFETSQEDHITIDKQILRYKGDR